MPDLYVKRGDTLKIPCVYSRSGSVFDLTGTTITCQVRDLDDVLVDSATVTVTNAAAGQFVVEFAATEPWPEGQLQADIRYAFPDQVRSTAVFTIHVSRGVTRP